MKATKAKQGIAVVAIALFWASIAAAGIGDTVADVRYSVPGVVHSTYLATAFQCTSASPSGWNPTQVTVEVFDSTGLLAGVAQASVVGGSTVLITTGNIASLQPNAQMGVTGPLQGSARIISSERKLVCAAYVMSPGSVPGYMNSLPIVKKTTQKGQ